MNRAGVAACPLREVAELCQFGFGLDGRRGGLSPSCPKTSDLVIRASFAQIYGK
jgi:hypothetical protein